MSVDKYTKLVGASRYRDVSVRKKQHCLYLHSVFFTVNNLAFYACRIVCFKVKFRIVLQFNQGLVALSDIYGH